MMRLPRFLPCVALVGSVSMFVSALPALAQEAASQPVAAAPAAPAKANPLRGVADDFWHYASVGRYELATAEAQKLLAQKDQPVQVLEAFESAAADRKASLDASLLRWQGMEGLKDVVTPLIMTINEGYLARRADPIAIDNNIKRLSVSEQAYVLAVGRLRDSGEVAVPQMIDYLRDSTKREYQPAVRRALRDMGRVALNPLVAATEMKDAATLAVIAVALGDIGYPDTLAYLARLAKGPQSAPAVKAAATEALIRMGADPTKLDAAALFYDLGQKFYYRTSAITADPRNPTAYVWYWDELKGLMHKNVPASIYHDVMAMRATEYALKLDPGRAPAVSLWLAANYKREADLPADAKDPTRAEGQPSAHYYGVAAGTRYLNEVLTRAMGDRNPAVALKAVKSLQQIVGQSNLFAGQGGEPLVEALRYADRRVRFESAFALAAALPQKSFFGQERVVPILAEAVAQTGKPGVLVVVPQDKLNGLVQGLKDAGYSAAGAANATSAAAAAATLPAIDVILVSESAEVDRVRQLAAQTPRLEQAAVIVITASKASAYATQAANNPLLTVTQVTDAPALKPVIEDARQRAGALPLDEKLAAEYALRSAELLGKLAISRGQVLDLSAAETTLLGALDDARPEIVKAVGNVLALLNSKQAQMALAAKAVDDKTAEDVKISLYKSLATSAKFFGNQLEGQQIDQIQKAVEAEKSLDVRGAAAEARGALNLPADQARTLIVNQSKM